MIDMDLAYVRFTVQFYKPFVQNQNLICEIQAKCMKAPDHLIITSSTRCSSSQDDRHSFIVFQRCAILQIVPVQWGEQRV